MVWGGLWGVVNLGDDADTTAAIYGALAGAFYGAQAIPKHWLTALAFRPLILVLADEIFHLVMVVVCEELKGAGEKG